MFGGAGLYVGDVFFGLVDDDMLFFKSDETTREDFLSRGSEKWSPPGMAPTFGYLSVPSEILEDRDELTLWVRKACDVALRKKAAKPKRKTTR
jgi:DNA transformation protein